MTRRGGNALDDIAEAASNAIDAPDLRGSDRRDEDERYDRMAWPADAPIVPLGIEKRNIWLLDATNQLLTCDTRLSKNDMVLMAGGSGWLTDTFPQFGKPEKGQPAPIVGFDQKTSSEALVTACQRRGVFNPVGRVFGRGAHRSGDLDERLMLHLGNAVMIAGEPDVRGQPGPMTTHRAGKVGELFFPADRALPPPANEASHCDDAAALLAEYRKWFWVEPKTAPLLLLGMTGQMAICGALEWRAHVWLAGPTAAGKSSLQKLVRAVHDGWCLQVEDASEAAIRQILGNDTLPVMIDEAEADDNADRQRAIINLAKKASSGAKIIRGGADHKGQEFTAQSCFLLSSVIHSLEKGEDLNRFAVLNMLSIPEPKRDNDGRMIEWNPPDLKRWREVGRRMHRRMIDQWSRFESTLSTFKREIASHGIEGRWQDTYGTLLACAHMLMFDCAPAQMPAHDDGFMAEKQWVLDILPMLRRGRIDARTDVDRCIAYLLGSQLHGANGKAPEAVGQWLIRAMKPVLDGNNRPAGPDEQARDRLRQMGLRVVTVRQTKNGFGVGPDPLPDESGWEDGYLAIAHATCKPLNELFRGTMWFEGKWHQSLAKIEGAKLGGKIRFAGPNPDNAIAIPLRVLRGDDRE